MLFFRFSPKKISHLPFRREITLIVKRKHLIHTSFSLLSKRVALFFKRINAYRTWTNVACRLPFTCCSVWHSLAHAYLPTYSLYRITKVIKSHKCYLEGRVGINYCRGGFACSTKGDHRHRHSILYGIQIDWTPCGAARKIYLWARDVRPFALSDAGDCG